MNKKGQGLPLNTVVMAILVIVVLILILTFFFGGFTGLSMKMREIFFGTLAGTSRTLAIQQCNQYCDQLQWAGVDKIGWDASQFCKCKAIDTDEDGKADKNWNCEDLQVTCSYIDKSGQSVNVECAKTCKTLEEIKTEIEVAKTGE